jgi:hypothetical protein
MTGYKDSNFPRHRIDVECASDSDSEFAARTAELFINPAIAATRVICASEDKAGLAELLDVPSLIHAMENLLSEQKNAGQDKLENILLAQATALQALFVRLTERAMNDTRINYAQTWLKLALRAQAQSKSCLETLLHMRRAPAIYAAQANLASLQQFNNLQANFLQNELSEEINELCKKPEPPGNAGKADKALETMETINRTQNQTRKAQSRSKCI